MSTNAVPLDQLEHEDRLERIRTVHRRRMRERIEIDMESGESNEIEGIEEGENE